MTKKEWRLHLQSSVKNLSMTQKQEYSVLICENIAKEIQPANLSIGIYAATQDEPNLRNLHHLLPSVPITYPLCGENASMAFHAVSNGDQLVKGTYGIMEPRASSETKVEVHEMSTICCPGWGFTTTGKRLGKGGGYYDRYLDTTIMQKIGVCFHCQLVDDLPCETHDVEMSLIITEKGIFKTKI